MLQSLPNSVLQMSVIFLSIVIEALPFVLLGCLISRGAASFSDARTSDIKKSCQRINWPPLQWGVVLGVFFPSCECGIVPIVNQFVKKTYQSPRLLLLC